MKDIPAKKLSTAELQRRANCYLLFRAFYPALDLQKLLDRPAKGKRE